MIVNNIFEWNIYIWNLKEGQILACVFHAQFYTTSPHQSAACINKFLSES